ncbi:MAG: hypothetical protein K2P33_00270, partial [Acutalibacter sp.]|nr:hypothetical protein [Acutalibacter sp.]
MTKRKILAVIMCLALTVSAALSGCGQTTSQSSSQSQSSSSSAASSESQAESSEVSSQPETDGTSENGIVFDDQGRFVKYDPPLTLTTHAVVGANDMFHDGCDIENNGWTQ